MLEKNREYNFFSNTKIFSIGTTGKKKCQQSSDQKEYFEINQYLVIVEDTKFQQGQENLIFFQMKLGVFLKFSVVKNY